MVADLCLIMNFNWKMLLTKQGSATVTVTVLKRLKMKNHEMPVKSDLLPPKSIKSEMNYKITIPRCLVNIPVRIVSMGLKNCSK